MNLAVPVPTNGLGVCLEKDWEQKLRSLKLRSKPRNIIRVSEVGTVRGRYPLEENPEHAGKGDVNMGGADLRHKAQCLHSSLAKYNFQVILANKFESKN